MEAGDVVVIDIDRPGFVSLASVSGETAVFGVVAGEPGVVREEVPVAVSGVVLCKVDAAYGPIRPGDLLTTSPTPGHAMRAIAPEPGAILGKAFEPLDDGAGIIKVLVMLR